MPQITKNNSNRFYKAYFYLTGLHPDPTPYKPNGISFTPVEPIKYCIEIPSELIVEREPELILTGEGILFLSRTIQKFIAKGIK